MNSKHRNKYIGLQGYKYIPVYLITLGDKACDTAIKDALNHNKVQTIFSTRSPMDKIIRNKKNIDLIVNHSDHRVIYMILRDIMKYHELVYPKEK